MLKDGTRDRQDVSSTSSPIFLSVQQVIAQLEISERTLTRWVEDGVFPKPAQFGSKSYWPRGELDQWARSKFKEANPDLSLE